MDAARIDRVSIRAAWGVAAGMVALVWLSLILHPRHASGWDQDDLILRGGLSWHPFTSGIASRWIAGLTGLFGTNSDLRAPSAVLHNTILRGAAASVLITGLAAALLAVGARTIIIVLSLLVVVVAGIPWFWLSSEVLASAGIAWIVWSAIRGRTLILVLSAIFLMFAKPDLLVPGLAFSALVASKTQRVLIAAAAAVVLALSLLSHEPSYDRATMSFGEHYANMKYRVVDPGLFQQWELYRDIEFGSGMSVWQIAWAFPAAYAWFVVHSIWMSMTNLWISGFWILLPICAWAMWDRRTERLAMAALAFLVLSGLLLTALSYFHVRYLARFLVLGLVLIGNATRMEHPRFHAAAVASLTLCLGYQALSFPKVLADGIWFYD